MYKNLKIRTKLALGFGTIVVASIIMMIIALLCLNSVGTLSHKLYTGPFVSTTETIGIKADLNAIGKDLRSAILSKDVETYKKSMKETKAQLDGRIEKLKVSFEGDKQLITDLETAMKNLV